MPTESVILDAPAIQRALIRIAHEIAERNTNGHEVVLVGIQRGGVTGNAASERRAALDRRRRLGAGAAAVADGVSRC